MPATFTMVTGGSVQMRASYNVACQPTATAFDWSINDTTIAVIDSAGTVTGRRSGVQFIVTVAARANPNLRAFATGTVVPIPGIIAGLTVTPQSIDFAPLDTVRLRAQVALVSGAPAGTSTAVTFRSLDTCIARVDSSGLVTALRYSASTSIVVASAAVPFVAQIVAVRTPQPPPGPSFGFQSLTVGTSATAVDPAAVRGVITATVGLQRAVVPASGRVELWLAGRRAATASFGPATPGTTFSAVSLTIDTAQRDAAGAALYPSGSQTLEARVFSDGGATLGCAATAAGQIGVVTQAVTLTNP